MLTQPLRTSARMRISRLSWTTFPASAATFGESGYPLPAQRPGYVARLRPHRLGHASASNMLEKLNH